MRDGEAGPIGTGPIRCNTIVNPPDFPDKAELACRIVTVAWAIVAARLPYRSAIERLHALQDAGLVMDDVDFHRIASGLR